MTPRGFLDSILIYFLTDTYCRKRQRKMVIPIKNAEGQMKEESNITLKCKLREPPPCSHWQGPD